METRRFNVGGLLALIAVVLFVLAALGVTFNGVNLGWLGAAFLAAERFG
jgi:hypothetical protein